MAHNIYDEQKIYAYRKLIDSLQNRSVKFFDNQMTDMMIFADLGIYQKNSIFILFGLNEFWWAGVDHGYISITLKTDSDRTIEEGIEYLIEIYKQTILEN